MHTGDYKSTKIKIKREDSHNITYLFDSLSNKLYKMCIDFGNHTWVSTHEVMLKEYKPELRVWWHVVMWDYDILYKLNDFDIVKRKDIKDFVNKLQVLAELES